MLLEATELKNQLDILRKNIQQLKSFRSLSPLIQLIGVQEKELRELSQSVMKQQSHQNTVTKNLCNEANLTVRLSELQLQVDLLDVDGHLNQSCSRIRDEVSLNSSRWNQFLWSTHVSLFENKDNQLQCDAKEHQSSTANTKQPPAIPPWQGVPRLFNSHLLHKVTYIASLTPPKQQSEIQKTGNSQRDQPHAVTEKTFHLLSTLLEKFVVRSSPVEWQLIAKLIQLIVLIWQTCRPSATKQRRLVPNTVKQSIIICLTFCRLPLTWVFQAIAKE